MLPQLPSRCPSSQESDSNSNFSTAGSRDPGPQPLQPKPIYQMKAGDRVLFAEFVQSARGGEGDEMLWVRPIFLVDLQQEDAPACDLSHASDLLWPSAHFSPAYVEEMLPYMANIRSLSLEESRQQLLAFVRLAWQVSQSEATDRGSSA